MKGAEVGKGPDAPEVLGRVAVGAHDTDEERLAMFRPQPAAVGFDEPLFRPGAHCGRLVLEADEGMEVVLRTNDKARGLNPKCRSMGHPVHGVCDHDRCLRDDARGTVRLEKSTAAPLGCRRSGDPGCRRRRSDPVFFRGRGFEKGSQPLNLAAQRGHLLQGPKRPEGCVRVKGDQEEP